MIGGHLREYLARLPANLRGAMMVSLGALLLVTMTTLVKGLGDSLHSFEIVFFRCLIGFLLLIPLLFKARGAWPTPSPRRCSCLQVGKYGPSADTSRSAPRPSSRARSKSADYRKPGSGSRATGRDVLLASSWLNRAILTWE